MSERSVPEGLLRFVASDLRPVKPLSTPARRALALTPLGVALLVGMPLLWGLRENVSLVGDTLAWGVSGLQSCVGLAVVGLALRESIPGQELSRRSIAAAFFGSVLLVVMITLLTSFLVPTSVPPGADLRYFWECFFMALGPGLGAFAVAAMMATRAFPARPAVAGALYGLGTGIMTDSGSRIFCWVSSPGHVLAAHGGVVVFLMVLGALTASLVDRRRSLRPRRDEDEEETELVPPA